MSTAPQEDGMSLERVVFFSDAVFAIAITLLVLEIKAPHVPPSDSALPMVQALVGLIPKFIGFVVSFIVLGSFWIEHHRIFRYIRGFDAGLLWKNLILLLAVAFVPFPTALFSENYTSTVALLVYALTLAGVGLLKLVVWRHAVGQPQLLGPAATPALVHTISRRSWAVPLTGLTVALLAGLGWRFAYVGFGLIPAVAWLLSRGRAVPDPATAASET
jgi:uncharacterized membrane protein